jgi:tRNA pseudouridine55 synthase
MDISHVANEFATTGSVLLIDKPLNWTSFDVVNKLRFRLKTLLKDKKLKVGHAGTLDPLATGLLIVCVGKMTKQIDRFMGLPKVYTGTMRLGATTPSYDAETEINETFETAHITPSVLEHAKAQFQGDIEQLPPIFSAIKQGGTPLYEMARKGQEVIVEPRKVHIHQFEITDFTNNELSFYVKCSKGTYIRSLAYDFGKACGSGAYLTSLCRTEIGEFQLKNAWNLEELITEINNHL